MNAKDFEGIEAVNNSFTLVQDKTQKVKAGLMVTLLRSKVNPDNLAKIIESKSGLIKNALGIDCLPMDVTKSTVSFSWFNELPTVDECIAYMDFITALCRMSVKQKRVTASKRIEENEKYAFRCFLLRLGFIGSECKQDRKILLNNLEGNAVWKGGKEY